MACAPNTEFTSVSPGPELSLPNRHWGGVFDSVTLSEADERHHQEVMRKSSGSHVRRVKGL